MDNTLYYIYRFTCPKCQHTKLICTKEVKDIGFHYCFNCKQCHTGNLVSLTMIDPLQTEVCPSCFDIVPIDESGKCKNCHADTNYKLLLVDNNEEDEEDEQETIEVEKEVQ